MDRIEESLGDGEWRRHIVCDTGDGVELSTLALLCLPNTDESDQEVVGEAAVKHLRDKENVGRESALQHDWHVGSVEETDGVRSSHAPLAAALDWDFNAEALKIDDGCEDGEGG
jgi:hypothetical protein